MKIKNSPIKIWLFMAILVCSAGLLFAPVLAAPKWPIPDGIKTIQVNGYDMAYQESGSGIPLILIHGGVNDYRTWGLQVPEFSKAFRTIAVSLRHCYPEKWNGAGDDYSVAQHTSDVAALIKSLNLGKVHLLGHSRGGEVALNVAKIYPDGVRTLVLEDGGGLEALLPDSHEKKMTAAYMKSLADYMRELLAKGDFDYAAQVYVNRVNGPGTWEKLPPERRQIPLDNIGTSAENPERPKVSCADIQKFQFPVLLINGARSWKGFGEMGAAMRQCKPEIPAPLIVPNAAHLMHRDNPDFFNKSVLDFLNKH